MVMKCLELYSHEEEAWGLRVGGVCATGPRRNPGQGSIRLPGGAGPSTMGKGKNQTDEEKGIAGEGWHVHRGQKQPLQARRHKEWLARDQSWGRQENQVSC